MQMVLLMFIIVLASACTLIVFLTVFGPRREGEGVPNSVPLLAVFSTILWFIAAAGVTAIDEPYTFVIENAENLEQYVVVEGTRVVTSNWPLAYLFFGLALFCLVMVFVAYGGKIKEWLFEPRPRRGGF